MAFPSRIKVKFVLSAGMRKINVPVLPVDPAAKLVGKFESEVGALVLLPDLRRV